MAPTPISLITFSAAPFFHHAGPVSFPWWDGPHSHQALAMLFLFAWSESSLPLPKLGRKQSSPLYLNVISSEMFTDYLK